MDHRQALNDEAVEVQRSLARLQRVAGLLDNAFRLPGTSWRVGWDSLLGVIPGVGDVLTAGVSLWIVGQARRLGAPRRLQVRMLGRLAADTLLGSVPLVGDLFDAGYKANVRNVKQLQQWLDSRQG